MITVFDNNERFWFIRKRVQSVRLTHRYRFIFFAVNDKERFTESLERFGDIERKEFVVEFLDYTFTLPAPFSRPERARIPSFFKVAYLSRREIVVDSARKIRQPILSNHDIRNAFDGIANYAK